MTDSDIMTSLLTAAKPHVPFDGWSEATFMAAIADSGLARGKSAVRNQAWNSQVMDLAAA